MTEKRINIRIDEELKEAAKQVFSDIGLDMTSAITLFLKQAVNVKGLPFRPSFDLRKDNK